MLKKLSVIFLSIILIISIMPQTATAAPRFLGKDDAYFLRLGVRLDDRPDNTERLGDFIAENKETGVKYKLECTGETDTNAGTEYMYYIVKNLPLGVYDVYAEDDIHTIYRFTGVDFNSLNEPGYENTWGIGTAARMFTVEYKDRDTGRLLFTQYVQYGHYSRYRGEMPTKPGYRFVRWRRSDNSAVGALTSQWYIYDGSANTLYAEWTPSSTYTARLNITLDGQYIPEVSDETARALGEFSLQDADNSAIIYKLNRGKRLAYAAENIPNGTYYILRNNERINDAGAVIRINDANGEATLPFYSVHYMDKDTELAVRCEREGTKMPGPVTPPAKEGYVFDKWVTQKDGETEFDFEQNLTAQTFIYAKYKESHTHSWSDTYEYDGDSHWHECGTPDCPITDNSQKEGFGEHTYGEWTVTKQPTVSEYGEKERRCTVCGRKETESVEKLPEDGHTHSYTGKQEIIKEPSCTEEGVKRIYCALEDCGEYIEEKIEKSAHDYDTSEWKYDSAGHWHICKNCGTAGEKNAHRMSGEPVITPPEGNTPGLKTWECEDCGYVKNEIIPVTPPEEKPTAPNEPEKPTAPSEPEKPTAPSEPENPTVPSEPEKPTVPSEPEKPSAPDEPQKPPMTGDTARVQVYATLAMIAGMLYLLLYFADGSIGMTEEEKNKLVSRLIGWAKGRNIIVRYAAIAAVFMLLLVYHSFGRKVEADFGEMSK